MSMTLEKHGNASEMNVTPLIDVLLVLLIIFMVLPHHRGELAEIPQADSHPIPLPRPEAAIVIELTDAGNDLPPAVNINRKPVLWSDLNSALRDIYEKRREKVLYLKGDPEIDFEYVAEAVDIAHHAGADRVGLLSNQGAGANE